MNERESDPTGAFHGGGAAGLDDAADGTPRVRPDREAGRDPALPDSQADSVTPGVDDEERETITSGRAASSEIADRDAQDDAEAMGQGTPRPL